MATRTHLLKILGIYATAKLDGDKLFEIRDNTDRGFQKGDFVSYKVVDNYGLSIISHPLNKHVYEITYVTNYNQKDGYVVFGERLVDTGESINADIEGDYRD